VNENGFLSDSEVLAQLVSLFERSQPENRERLYQTLGTYLGFNTAARRSEGSYGTPAREAAAAVASFTEDRSVTPKEFIGQKQPQTDVERVACLAYYLTHFTNTPHFKTIDISRANTEAAQIKFSNPSYAVENATLLGYLAHAGKGFKQLSSLGEEYVSALPDREAAKAVMARRRRPRRKAKKASSEESHE
jgi:hypothetical protein